MFIRGKVRTDPTDIGQRTAMHEIQLLFYKYPWIVNIDIDMDCKYKILSYLPVKLVVFEVVVVCELVQHFVVLFAAPR